MDNLQIQPQPEDIVAIVAANTELASSLGVAANATGLASFFRQPDNLGIQLEGRKPLDGCTCYCRKDGNVEGAGWSSLLSYLPIQTYN